MFFSCVSSYDYEYLTRVKFDEATKKYLKGEYKEAIALYEELLNSYKNGSFQEIISLNLANLYLVTKNYPAGLNILNRLISNAKDEGVLGGANFALANYYYEERKFDLAKIYITKALQYPDKFYSLYIALQLAAKVCYYMNEIKDAKYYFIKLANTYPTDPYSQKIISVLDILSRGEIFLQLGKFSSFDNAKNLVTKLSVLGYNPILKESIIAGERSFLVFINCQTQQLCGRLKSDLNNLEIDAIEIP